MLELIAAMKAGGDADQLRAIVGDADEGPILADPDSPAAVRLAEEIWNDTRREKERKSSEEASLIEFEAECEQEHAKRRGGYSDYTHPFMYGGVEVSDMKKHSLAERVGLMKIMLQERNIELIKGDFSTLPPFLEIYQTLFGKSFEGAKAGSNLFQAARHVYQQITGQTVPETSKLDLEVREK